MEVEMKVCLINPPNIFEKPMGYEWYPNIFTLPYLGMGYITASLRDAGYDVVHIDCPLLGFDEKDVYAVLNENEFDVIGISNFYYNLLPTTKIVKYINKHFKNTFVFVGGFLPTLDYKTILNMKMQIDCCIVGAGERTVVELLQKIEHNEDWTTIEGIAYFSGSEIINNKRSSCLNDLDLLPFPYRDTSFMKIRHVSILSSRGCYGDCTFCGEKEYAIENASPHIRYRSVNNVMDEITLLWNECRFEKLRFNDSNFLDGSLTRKKWLKDFVESLNSCEFSFKYSCNARANDIITHKELLPNLYKSGLEAVFLGIESFNQRQLNLYSKRTTVQQNIMALEILKNCGIKVEIGLIIIEPFVTVEEFIENLRWLEETAFFDIVDITQNFISSSCTLISIPGTRMYEILEKEGVATKRNELGYIFKDERMKGLHEALKQWEKETKHYADKRYLIYKALAEKDDLLAEELAACYKELLKADFLFLKEVAIVAKDCANKEESYKHIIEKARKHFSLITKNTGFVE